MPAAALPAVVLRLEQNVRAPATWARHPIRPAVCYKVLTTVVRIGEVENRFLEGVRVRRFHGKNEYQSIWPLANCVAVWSVVTNPYFSVRISGDSAADELSAAPNNLRVVSATGGTAICGVIVIGCF